MHDYSRLSNSDLLDELENLSHEIQRNKTLLDRASRKYRETGVMVPESDFAPIREERNYLDNKKRAIRREVCERILDGKMIVLLDEVE